MTGGLLIMTTATATEVTATTTWNIDPVHSHAEFKVRHMMISNVKGEFNGVTGTLRHSEDLTKSGVEVSIDAATVNTGDAQRDAHLKSADFFDVEKFPALTFKSNRVSKNNKDGVLTAAGELTIHGVTRNVAFEVEGPSAPMKDPWGNTRIGLSATTRINRKDFGLTWNAALETGGILVGDDVTITLDIQFIKA